MAKNLWFGFWKASPRYITTDLIAKPSWYQVNHRNNCTKGFRTRGTVSLNIEVKELIRWHAVWGSHMLSKKIERLYAIHLPGFFSDLGWPIEPFFGRWCFKVSMKERVCSSQGNRWIFKQTITSLFICLADWWVPGRTYFSPDWRYLASREVGVNPRMALSVYEFETLFSEHALIIRTQHRAIMEKMARRFSEWGFLWSPRFWAPSGTCLIQAPAMGSLLKPSCLSTVPFCGLRNVCKWTWQVFAHLPSHRAGGSSGRCPAGERIRYLRTSTASYGQLTSD